MQKLHISESVINAVNEHFVTSQAPIYVYDTLKIRSNCRSFMKIPYHTKAIHFATMANINPTFLRIIRDEGIQVFVNSIPHMQQVLEAGYTGSEIIFTASAMNEEAMKAVLECGASVNLDSLKQIADWEKVSGGRGFGIRCNIGNLVKPRKTRAGYFLGKTSRLGLSIQEMKSLKGNPRVKGLHLYVGTDIMEIDYFLECYRKLGEFIKWYPELEYLDVGGGFGIEDINLSEEFDLKTYGQKVSSYMEELCSVLNRPVNLILEPGRILGGKAGYFACSVVDVKLRQKKQLIGVNASVSQFPRPLFYPDTAVHPVAVLDSNGGQKDVGEIKSLIHGCSTYSRDLLAKNIDLGRVEGKDIIVFGHAGSYCASSYTEFLGFRKPEELFV
ncbi:diaminopimelate decarboxylase [Ruminiclostridium hungatei]|uniref:Diaminopimelate decarboxylase n=1 Tax=Ruminiclostridium hungatei TaxID=48256 RepID=A0A1V4SIS7_RUMHU|nr:hypothetical protein [Ruminiclostridium hungatei]OPX43157.1 diaminopimelate decarboxylase [Ruminiclostridium hungatei]